MAVLCRTNRYCELVSGALESLDIPHLTIDRYRFFRRAEIKDALAHLRILLNRHDANSLRRVLARPPRGIGRAALGRIEGLPRDLGLRLVDLADRETLARGDPFGLLLEELERGRVVLFDLETTGLDPAGDAIVELAAARIGPGGVLSRFHEYLRPARPVGSSCLVHGLSDGFLSREGRPPREVLEAFLGYIDGCVLVGHNVGFDLAVLRGNLGRLGMPAPARARAYDTLEMARRFRSLQSYNLRSVCEALGVEVAAAHRAADDVRPRAGFWSAPAPRPPGG